MAERFIINGTQAALAVQGETTAARTATDSTGAPTDAETGALVDTAGVAMTSVTPSAANKRKILSTLVDNLSSVLDLSTAVKREEIRRRRSKDDMEKIFDAVLALEAK